MARLEGPPPTKEFFSPATGGKKASNIANHTGYLVNTDLDIARMEFVIPHDFHKLIKAELVWIAKAAVTNMFLDGYMRYGGHNEHYGVHAYECDVTRTTAENRIYRDDVSVGLTAAAPLDNVGYSVGRPSGGNANAFILGVRVRYV